MGRLGRAASAALLAHLVDGDEEERSKGYDEEEDGGGTVELIETVRIEVPIEKREADEDEEDMRAEDPERGFAEGEEGFNFDEPERVSASSKRRR